MAEETSYLAQNIRFLRKQKKLSQEKLAAALGIKRSNIAAYETKNVEPRLSLISKMADFFQISLADLITQDLARALSKGVNLQPLTENQSPGDAEALRQFSRRVEEMRKLLEGFQVFYQYRQATMRRHAADHALPNNDIENFLIFIDQVVSYNNEIFDFLTSRDIVDERSEPTSILLPAS